jgi:hypothetical protein
MQTNSQLEHHQEQMESARAEFARLHPNVPPQDEMRLWREFLKQRGITEIATD